MEKINISEFARSVYGLCSQIPKGKVTTYKAIANQLGIKSSQAVGQALRCNPYAPKVPCHRVVSSTGSLGGFKGKTFGKEMDEKISLLQSEGVVISSGKIDLEKYGFVF